MTPEQIESRRYLGSADMGPVMALYRPELAATLAKYSNSTDVWLRLVHGVSQPRNKAMSRGLKQESALRQLYRESVGQVDEPPGVLLHPRLEFAAGSPDGLSPDGVTLVEFKTASVFGRNSWGEPGTDRVPDSYAVQVQWLLGVTGRQVAHVLVAWGRDVRDDEEHGFVVEETGVYLVPRDDELIAALESFASQFWLAHVATGVPPPMAPAHNKRIFSRLTRENHMEAAQ